MTNLITRLVLWLVALGGDVVARRVRYEVSAIGATEAIAGLHEAYSTRMIGGPLDGTLHSIAGEGRFAHVVTTTQDGAPVVMYYERLWCDGYPRDTVAVYMGAVGPSVPRELWPG